MRKGTIHVSTCISIMTMANLLSTNVVVSILVSASVLTPTEYTLYSMHTSIMTKMKS